MIGGWKAEWYAYVIDAEKGVAQRNEVGSRIAVSKARGAFVVTQARATASHPHRGERVGRACARPQPPRLRGRTV